LRLLGETGEHAYGAVDDLNPGHVTVLEVFQGSFFRAVLELFYSFYGTMDHSRDRRKDGISMGV
jgi:hypothetical protein